MPPKPLNYVNLVNVAAFVANVYVTYGIGVMGWHDYETNREISERYQTIITPAGWGFAIWGLIFASELVFVLVQLLPKYRNHKVVQDGVKDGFLSVCFAQILWTLTFGNEYIPLSFLAMLLVLLRLLKIVIKCDTMIVSNKEYYLLKFPFLLHCGWIMAAAFVNLSVVLVFAEVSSEIQLAFAVASIVALVFLADKAVKFDDHVIPLVFIWALYAIFDELDDPIRMIVQTFHPQVIDNVRWGSLGASILIGFLIVMQFSRDMQEERKTSSPGTKKKKKN